MSGELTGGSRPLTRQEQNEALRQKRIAAERKIREMAEVPASQVHPAVEERLRFFEYEHLPIELRKVSKPFCELAHQVANNPDLSGAQVTECMQRLLESKDCAVRAAL